MKSQSATFDKLSWKSSLRIGFFLAISQASLLLEPPF